LVELLAEEARVMKIAGRENAVQMESGQQAEQGSLRNYLAWLHALEQAQWSQRLRYQTQEGALAKNGEDGEEAGGTVTSRAEAAVTLSGTGDARGTGSIAGNAGRMPDSGVQAVPAVALSQSPGVPGPTVFADASFPALNRIPDGASGHDLVRGRLADGRHDPAPCRPQHAHVMVDGTGLHLWLRDARIDQESGLKLLWSLRKQLQSAGIDLVSLTLNGYLVEAPSAPRG
jgi:hypothetical protein